MPSVPLNTPVFELGLSTKTANCLVRAGINTLQDLLVKRETAKRLQHTVQQAGKKTQDEVDRNMDRLERLAGPEGLAAMVMES